MWGWVGLCDRLEAIETHVADLDLCTQKRVVSEMCLVYVRCVDRRGRAYLRLDLLLNHGQNRFAANTKGLRCELLHLQLMGANSGVAFESATAY